MKIRAAVLLPLALLFAGCDDPTDVEDHLDIFGVALYEGDTELFRYLLSDGSVVESFELDVGTHEVVWVMLDEDGDPLVDAGHADEEHEEHDLTVDIQRDDLLTWTPEEPVPGEEHEHLEFHGELDALAVGSTQIELCVPHGDAHCDFESPPITVTIIP